MFVDPSEIVFEPEQLQHPDKKPIKVIAAIIMHPQMDRVLLGKRQFRKPLGGHWELPSTLLRRKEAPIDALIREMDNALGILPLQYEVIHQQLHNFKNHDVFVSTYLVKEYHGEVIMIPPKNHRRLEWFIHPKNISPLPKSVECLLPLWDSLIMPHFNKRKESRIAEFSK